MKPPGPAVRALGPLLAALTLLLAWPTGLLAHGDKPAGPWDLWNHWPVRASIALPILAFALAYTRGVRRLWERGGRGRQITRVRVLAFAAGMLFLVGALLTPLDPLGEVLFSAHMVQHLVLILVAAPLIVAGAPEIALLWALPAGGRKAVGRWVARFERIVAGDASALLSLVTVAIATIVLWAWHVPALYDLAIANEAVHAAEHGAFLATALLFWATVLRVRPRAHLRNGIRVLLVFAMAVQGSVLGALITFATRPLYESHASIPEAWGIESLADQQLAGLIMWIPPALLYIGVAAYLFVRWLEEVERRSRERELRLGIGPASAGGVPSTGHEQSGRPAQAQAGGWSRPGVARTRTEAPGISSRSGRISENG